jgi:7-keto-8-aminopelargonate synthetase-like enzyme
MGTPARVLSGPAGARVVLDGREYINFAGSTYLALGGLQELRDAALKAIEGGAAFSCQLPAAYGVADALVESLEERAAAYCGTEDAVYMASGYLIGAAALASLNTTGSMLFIDESAHFSLFDAGQLTGLPLVPFKHCDADALEQVIHSSSRREMRPLVITDGVFGTDGRVAPLDRYAALIAPFDGRLVVDEAHSFGVLGQHGRGAAEHHGVESVATTAATLSKAFCAHGAIIGCKRAVADKLRRVPPLRGANVGSPITAAVASASIRYVHEHPERRARLSGLTSYLRARLADIGIETGDSPAPIVAFRMGVRAVMQSIQEALFRRGIYVLISNYIGAGAEGIIRCAVFADHSEADLDSLVDSLRELSAGTLRR